MTRESAKQHSRSFCYEDRIDRFIDKIFDDFESRTCENCKYFVSEDGYPNTGCIKYAINFKDFGCNKFERKDK